MADASECKGGTMRGDTTTSQEKERAVPQGAMQLPVGVSRGGGMPSILCLMTQYRKTSECNEFYLFKLAIESNKSNHFLVNH